MVIASPPSIKRIPTLLGLIGVLVSVVVVAATSYGVREVTKTFSQADSPEIPISVGVSNVSDNSATIYWLTDKETAGSIYYGKSSKLGDGVTVDSRDQLSANSKFPTHLVRLTNLKPNTKYFFKVGVNANSYGDPANKNDPYEFSTGSTLLAGPGLDPIFGNVVDSAGNAPPGTIVVWETPGAQKMVTMVKTDGSYVLPVANTRTDSLDKFYILTEGLPETIIFLPGAGSSEATISCKIGQDKPLPPVKLGETTDCTKKTTPINSGFKAPPAGSADINVQDGQTFSTALPTISGKAGPNQIVQIVIHSETPYSGTVQAGPDGSWAWTPPANLAPGQHTVTITVVNPDSTTQTITRTFTVTAGSPILPITSGTPSAVLTHMACVENSCTAVAGVGPNSCSTNADCVVAPTPAPPPPPTPPRTGSLENTLILLTIGFIFVTLGTVLVFKPNGSE